MLTIDDAAIDRLEQCENNHRPPPDSAHPWCISSTLKSALEGWTFATNTNLQNGLVLDTAQAVVSGIRLTWVAASMVAQR